MFWDPPAFASSVIRLASYPALLEAPRTAIWLDYLSSPPTVVVRAGSELTISWTRQGRKQITQVSEVTLQAFPL